MFIRAHLSLLTLVAAVAAVSPIASAAAAPVVRVAYHDLDLNTDHGVSTLYQRIRRAAATYCRSSRVATGTRVSSVFNLCVHDAVATTVQKIDQPNLSAYFIAHADKSAS